MRKIQVEQPLGRELAELKGQALLYDADGRALGFFSPMQQTLQVDDLQLEPPTSWEESEELRMRARANPGRPLKDILKELGH
jgi:hypothetical protein